MSRPDAKRLFTERHATYDRFIRLVRYSQGIRTFFLRSPLLQSDLRILDAGCGTGVVTLALHEALAARGLARGPLHAFDLTPAMLEHFQRTLESRGIELVETRQANVLELDGLPDTWTQYHLIVTASMLEYVPRNLSTEAYNKKELLDAFHALAFHMPPCQHFRSPRVTLPRGASSSRRANSNLSPTRTKQELNGGVPRGRAATELAVL